MNKDNKILTKETFNTSLKQAFIKLNPKVMIKNPIMFCVEVCTAIMFVVTINSFFQSEIVTHSPLTTNHLPESIYNLIVTIILFLTVLFANFAKAIAEARGKAQADSLRKTREETPAKLVNSELKKGNSEKGIVNRELKSDNESNENKEDTSHHSPLTIHHSPLTTHHSPLTTHHSQDYTIINSSQLKKGDIFICEAGDVIPTDGEIIEGLATIDESAITGESAPVIREAGGDKSSVTGGTKVLSDKIKVLVTTQPGESFLDKMIALVEGASRQKTPNEIALTILLAGFTLVFIIVTITLKPFADYAQTPITIAAFISLFVCLIPTTIGGLLSAIGIAGMDRALRANVITKSGKAVETAGDVDVLLLDKTGTITIGNRKATHFYPANGVDEKALIKAVVLSSMADETPEGKSIIELGKLSLGNADWEIVNSEWGIVNSKWEIMNGERGIVNGKLKNENVLNDNKEDTSHHSTFTTQHSQLTTHHSPLTTQHSPLTTQHSPLTAHHSPFTIIKFTAETRCSGVNFENTRIRKGAADSIKNIVEKAGNIFPSEIAEKVKEIASNGGTPLVVSENEVALGVVELQDIIKPGIQERFERLRKMGIKTVMVTGDNPLTAKFIAEKAGVDDFIAEAKPEDKMNYIRKEQADGRLVAMMGDGTNDAPALAQADVGVAMNSGTQAAKEAGNMVDLDNDPTKLIEVVEIGKQLLMTRGTLTTFSIANDVAKYFAIIPALFITAIPALQGLNIMQLHSPESAILSAVIFNAIIIPLLIPLALKGVAYKPIGASALLRRNLFIYGLGGVILPFIGIKLIDLVVSLVM
jgi:K+-transporting ATPase ATPase B chain